MIYFFNSYKVSTVHTSLKYMHGAPKLKIRRKYFLTLPSTSLLSFFDESNIQCCRFALIPKRLYKVRTVFRIIEADNLFTNRCKATNNVALRVQVSLHRSKLLIMNAFLFAHAGNSLAWWETSTYFIRSKHLNCLLIKAKHMITSFHNHVFHVHVKVRFQTRYLYLHFKCVYYIRLKVTSRSTFNSYDPTLTLTAYDFAITIKRRGWEGLTFQSFADYSRFSNTSFIVFVLQSVYLTLNHPCSWLTILCKSSLLSWQPFLFWRRLFEVVILESLFIVAICVFLQIMFR